MTVKELTDKVSEYQSAVVSHTDSDDWAGYERARCRYLRQLAQIKKCLSGFPLDRDAASILKDLDTVLVNETQKLRNLLRLSELGSYPVFLMDNYCTISSKMERIVRTRNLIALALWITPMDYERWA